MPSPCPKIYVFSIGLIVAAAVWALGYQVQAVEFLPTSVEVIVTCGDGKAEGLEVCDPGEPPLVPPDVGTTTCADYLDVFGDPYEHGSMDCLSDCSDYDPSRCHTCGNAHKEEVEECDQSDFGGETCLTFGFDGGSLVCTSACQISTMNCEAREHEGGVPGGGGSGSGGGIGRPSGFPNGSENEQVTKLVVRGKSYPHADVHILMDGTVIGIVKADAAADFYFETTEITPGVASFGFWSEDIEGLKSTLLTLTLRVVNNAVTNITGVYIAPTIEVDQKSIKKGDTVRIYGQTIPDTKVVVHINSPQTFIEETDSHETGTWELNFNTEPLDEEFHTAKAYFQVEAGQNVIKSGFSKAVSFHVGKIGGVAVCPEADMNQDGRVNITDFSILLFNWGTDNACADQNQNGTVDLIDFSIMMYYWTG